VKLSILMCGLPSRLESGMRLLTELHGQIQALPNPADAEVIYLLDTWHMSVGEKRNRLLDAARGDYVVFVDDDDRIEPDYVQAFVDATETGADALCPQVMVTFNGRRPTLCTYTASHRGDDRRERLGTVRRITRITNHICAVKRSLAVRVRFPNASFAEDADYAHRLAHHIGSEHQIGRVLYHYRYSSATTETQRPEHRARTYA